MDTVRPQTQFIPRDCATGGMCLITSIRICLLARFRSTFTVESASRIQPPTYSSALDCAFEGSSPSLLILHIGGFPLDLEVI